MRLTIHLTAGLVLLFCAALGALRAQPYEDGGLRASLAPGCALPTDPAGAAPLCFLGIRPGVTTGADALRRLRELAWVADLQVSADRIEWTWSGQQPAFLRGAATNYAGIVLRGGVVRWIGVETAARAADVRIVFGAPASAAAFVQQVRDSNKNYYATFSEYAFYPAQGFEAVIDTRCPAPTASLWALPVMLVLPSAANAPRAPAPPDLPAAFLALPANCR